MDRWNIILPRVKEAKLFEEPVGNNALTKDNIAWDKGNEELTEIFTRTDRKLLDVKGAIADLRRFGRDRLKAEIKRWEIEEADEVAQSLSY